MAMVSILWGVIAFSLGLLIYLIPAVVAQTLPVEDRRRVGLYYYKNSLKSYRQVAFVRRQLAGFELLPITVDDEQRLAKVTLSSGLISDDKELPFKDPASCIGRLFNKPIAIVPETIPAAVDAKLSEIGYWRERQILNEGGERKIGEDEHGNPLFEVNPWVKVGTGLRIVDPIDIRSLVAKDVQPENVKTTEEMTKARFREYGQKVGLAETAGLMTGFAFGIGGVAVLSYIRNRILDGGGGSTPTNPLPPMGGGVIVPIDATPVLSPALDVLAVIL